MKLKYHFITIAWIVGAFVGSFLLAHILNYGVDNYPKVVIAVVCLIPAYFVYQFLYEMIECIYEDKK